MRSCYFKTPRPGGPKIQGPAAGRPSFFGVEATGHLMVTESPWTLFFDTFLKLEIAKQTSCLGLKAIVDTFASFPIWNPIKNLVTISNFRHFCGFQNCFKFEEQRRNPKIKSSFLADFSPNQTRTSGLIVVITCTLVPSLKLDWWYGKWVKMTSKIDHPHNHWLSLYFSWFNLTL